jgi:3'(2'), 5'-bisphosphate nucleotidase
LPTSPTEFERELEVASRLAREAGGLALRCRDGELEIEEKAGHGPVTIADRRASDHIVAGLRAAFSGDVVISEENADDPRRLQPGRAWYIDPIDGTKDFIRGEEGFCVMIGLALDFRPAVGVVYAPATDRLFYAAPGGGAWLVAPDAQPQRIGVSQVDQVERARFVASKSHRDETLDRVKNALGIDNELNIGSVGLKIALIAAGERDLYVNTSGKTASWDTCAPEALLAEAGGRVTDLFGDLLRYDTPDVHNPQGLIASNGLVHEAAVEKVAPIFPRPGQAPR